MYDYCEKALAGSPRSGLPIASPSQGLGGAKRRPNPDEAKKAGGPRRANRDEAKNFCGVFKSRKNGDFVVFLNIEKMEGGQFF